MILYMRMFGVWFVRGGSGHDEFFDQTTESAPKIGWDAPELVAMLRLRGLQETSNQDLRPFRRSRRVEHLLSALPHLLPPPRAVETFARDEIFVTAAPYNSPPLQSPY